MEYTDRYCKDEEGDHRLNPVPGDTEESDRMDPAHFLSEIPEKFSEQESKENCRNRGDDENIHQTLEPEHRFIDLFHDQGKYKNDGAICDIADHEPEKEREENCYQRGWVNLPVFWGTDYTYEKFKGFHERRVIIKGWRVVHFLRAYIKFDDNNPGPEGFIQRFLCPFQDLFGDPAFNQKGIFSLAEFAKYPGLFLPFLKHFF